MSKLKERIKQTKDFDGPAHEAMLNLIVAAATVREDIEDVCNRYDLSSSHYNVLRILGGGPEEGYPRCDIIDRMLDRGPDVTRLTDRLVKKGLVERGRSKEDGRLTMHRITPEGRQLLDAMQDDIRGLQEQFSEQLSESEQRQWSRLCASIYAEQ